LGNPVVRDSQLRRITRAVFVDMDSDQETSLAETF